MCLLFCSCSINTPGTGCKRGVIVRLEETGIICKTLQGEIIRGGMSDGTGSFGKSLYFTIEDNRNRELAQLAFQEQFEVIIYYENDLICSIFRSDNSRPNFVTHIERVYHD